MNFDGNIACEIELLYKFIIYCMRPYDNAMCYFLNKPMSFSHLVLDKFQYFYPNALICIDFSLATIHQLGKVMIVIVVHMGAK